MVAPVAPRHGTARVLALRAPRAGAPKRPPPAFAGSVSSDVMMPNRDGYELVRALRSDPKYRDTPIVLVTSKDARIDAVRGYDAGADAYLTKPADADELIRTLDTLLRQRRGQTA